MLKNLITVLILTVLIGYCTASSYNKSPPPTKAITVLPKSAQDIRKDKIDLAFSAWDGSHRDLVRIIKKNLRDPKSYEHIETKFADRGDHVDIIMKYRAKNGFGGMNIETVSAKASVEGTVTEIVNPGGKK